MKKILLTAILSALASIGASAQTTDSLWVDGSHSKLFTVVEKPSSDKNAVYDVCILCHGFSSDMNFPLIAQTAENLRKGGMATVRFDFNGHGKSREAKGGEFVNMTVPNEIEDLEKVISWTQSQPWCRSISLVGHSQGGVVVSMTAGKLGFPTIRKVALAAPAAVLREDAIMGRTGGAKFSWWDIKEPYVNIDVRGETWHLGKDYIETAVHLPIYQTAWNYRGSVYIMQGTHDPIVPFTYAELYNHGYANSELNLIPNADHNFLDNTSDYALNISSFILK